MMALVFLVDLSFELHHPRSGHVRHDGRNGSDGGLARRSDGKRARHHRISDTIAHDAVQRQGPWKIGRVALRLTKSNFVDQRLP
jgi:hypothetical protein